VQCHRPVRESRGTSNWIAVAETLLRRHVLAAALPSAPDVARAAGPDAVAVAISDAVIGPFLGASSTLALF
jgi:hypothetical protein